MSISRGNAPLRAVVLSGPGCFALSGRQVGMTTSLTPGNRGNRRYGTAHWPCLWPGGAVVSLPRHGEGARGRGTTAHRVYLPYPRPPGPHPRAGRPGESRQHLERAYCPSPALPVPGRESRAQGSKHNGLPSPHSRRTGAGGEVPAPICASAYCEVPSSISPARPEQITCRRHHRGRIRALRPLPRRRLSAPDRSRRSSLCGRPRHSA